jgi:hypothetical protein
MPSNAYGFDFLKSEHKQSADTSLEPIVSDAVVVDDSIPLEDAANKPDLEKQFIILGFLQKHRDSCLAPSLIYRATGIDLETDVTVATMLQNNPKVRVEYIPDPENPALQIPHYAYQAKYPHVRDRASLLAQVNRMLYGVPVRDLLDSYTNADVDIQGLITAGDVIAIQNTEDKDKILFPRGEPFYVELDGLLNVADVIKTSNSLETMETDKNNDSANNQDETNGNNKRSPKVDPVSSSSSDRGPEAQIFGVETDVDPRKQIRRGEAIQIGGQWFRVSSAVRAGVPLSEQPARAQAPLSVVSLADLSKRNELDGYIRPFTVKHIPVDAALSETAQNNIRQARKAREKLLKLAHGGSSGRSGSGVTAQLTGSYAHSSNPTVLAASFASSAVTQHQQQLQQQQQSQQQHQQQQQQQQQQRKRSSILKTGVVSKTELERAAADPALAAYSHARRHGCTLDVREMYLATRSLVPESDHDLHRILLEHKLLDPNEQMRRPRLTKTGTNVDNDGKPKKRRYYERKNQRMTNTHLEGTVIGAILARAAEKQKQGQSVGDGGM